MKVWLNINHNTGFLKVKVHYFLKTKPMYPKSQRDKFNAFLFFQEARSDWPLLKVVKSHTHTLMQWRLSKGRIVKLEHRNDPNI